MSNWYRSLGFIVTRLQVLEPEAVYVIRERCGAQIRHSRFVDTPKLCDDTSVARSIFIRVS